MLTIRLLCCALLLFSSKLFAALTIATIDWCPYICPNDNIRPGLLVEYTKEIYRDLNEEVHFEVYPWSRAIKMVNEGKVDALLSPAKNEAPGLVYPQQEIGVQQFCFFKRSNDKWRYKDINSIANRSIIYPSDALPDAIANAKHQAVLISYPYNDAYLPKATDILLKGRVDNFMMTSHSVIHYLGQTKLKKQISSAGCVAQQKLYLAFSPAKNLQHKIKPLLSRFDRNIIKLKKQGYFDTLLRKYDMK